MMGHRSINVTVALYGHLVKGPKRTAADQLSAYMGAGLTAFDACVLPGWG
jgi:hypothetical protein